MAELADLGWNVIAVVIPWIFVVLISAGVAAIVGIGVMTITEIWKKTIK